jgi:hypothetical protein
MHAQYFQEPKEDTIWTKTPNTPRDNGCPNYIKESNQHKIDYKDLSHYKKLIKPKHKGMR